MQHGRDLTVDKSIFRVQFVAENAELGNGKKN